MEAAISGTGGMETSSDGMADRQPGPADMQTRMQASISNGDKLLCKATSSFFAVTVSSFCRCHIVLYTSDYRAWTHHRQLTPHWRKTGAQITG
jgi:hypothetical protein